MARDGDERRVPFDEHAIAANFERQEKAVGSVRDPSVSFISQVVVMNKVLMATAFSAAKGKWWFAGLDAGAWPNDCGSVGVKFDGGLGTKPVRSIITADGRSTGKIYFSLTSA
ncbi:MAG: hypothetical protein J0H40_16995 [Rhizobiales bacterium]|nr:hypothetical protein [Hyphomicrobiales bacterium]